MYLYKVLTYATNQGYWWQGLDWDVISFALMLWMRIARRFLPIHKSALSCGKYPPACRELLGKSYIPGILNLDVLSFANAHSCGDGSVSDNLMEFSIHIKTKGISLPHSFCRIYWLHIHIIYLDPCRQFLRTEKLSACSYGIIWPFRPPCSLHIGLSAQNTHISVSI